MTENLFCKKEINTENLGLEQSNLNKQHYDFAEAKLYSWFALLEIRH